MVILTRLLLLILILLVPAIADAATLDKGNCGGRFTVLNSTLDDTTKNVGSCKITIPTPCTDCMLVLGAHVTPQASFYAINSTAPTVVYEFSHLESRTIAPALALMFLPITWNSVPAGVLDIYVGGLGVNTSYPVGWILIDGVDQRARVDTTKVTSNGDTDATATITLNGTGSQQTVSFITFSTPVTTISSVTNGTKQIDFVSVDGYKRLAAMTGGAVATHQYNLAASNATSLIGAVFQPSGTVNATTGTVSDTNARRWLQKITSGKSTHKLTVDNDYTAWNTGGRPTSGALAAPFQGDTDDYYDGRANWQLLAVILNDPTLNTTADNLIDAVFTAYENPNNFSLPGYRHFPYGYYLAWQRGATGSSAYPGRVNTLAGKTGAVSGVGSTPAYTVQCRTNGTYSWPSCLHVERREVSRALYNCVIARRMGQATACTVAPGTMSNKLETLIAQVNSALNYTYPEAYTGYACPCPPGEPGQLFMLGGAAKALVAYNDDFGDPRISTLIQDIATFMWNNRVPVQNSLRYGSNPPCTSQPCSGTYPYNTGSGLSDLDLLAAGVFYKAAQYSCNEDFAKKGDLVVNGWVLRGETVTIKQFNQALYWDDWRKYRADFYTTLGAGSCGAADTTLPSGTITNPLAGATITGATTLTVNASDNIAVAGATWKLDGTALAGEVTVAPYSLPWTPSQSDNGSRTISVVIRDTSNNTYTTSVAVTVNVPPPADTTPPTMTVDSPAEAAAISGTIPVAFTCVDNNPPCASVQLRVDGVNIGVADTTFPFSVSLDTTTLSDGNREIKGYGCDASANCTLSAIRNATVSNTPPNTPPTCTWSQPAADATISGNQLLEVNCSDTGVLQDVQFTLGGTAVGPLITTAAPQQYTLQTGLQANGAAVLGATARDTTGLQTAITRNVTISNVAADAVAPVCTGILPVQNTVVRGIVTLEATCTDNVGVVSVQFKHAYSSIVFSPLILLPTADPNIYRTLWDSTQWPNTYNDMNFVVVAKDAAGNTLTTAARQVIPDNTQTPTEPVKIRVKGKVRCLGTCRW